MRSAIIVAGGRGLRMGTHTPKQFLLLDDIPVLMHSIRAFHEADPSLLIVLALPADQLEIWHELVLEFSFNVDHTTVAGGETRFHSVKNGLSGIPDDGFIAIHDGVRPLLDPVFINRLFSVAETEGNAVPCIPVNETIRRIHGLDNVVVNRSEYRIIQTPQVFPVSALKKAYAVEYQEDFTDDASVFEAAGHKIHLCDGDPGNIKITLPGDLLVAQALLRRPFHE